MTLVNGSRSVENSFIWQKLIRVDELVILCWASQFFFFNFEIPKSGNHRLSRIFPIGTDLRIFVMHVLVSNHVWLQLPILPTFTSPSSYFAFCDTPHDYTFSELYYFQQSIPYSSCPHLQPL